MEEKNVTYRTRVHYIVPSQELSSTKGKSK